MARNYPHFFRVLSLGIFLASTSLDAADWPDTTAILKQNFGYPDNGYPSLGHSFSSNGALRASDSGELLFTNQSSNFARRLPSPLGDWTVVDHGDGIIAIYGRYEAPQGTGSYTIIEKGTILGNAGTSGWSSFKGFYFSLYDRLERRWVNPSILLPLKKDTRAPLIRSVRLQSENGRSINPAQQKSLKQGEYTILIETTDSIDEGGNQALAPLRILCFVNGNAQGALHLETICAQNGSLLVHGMQVALAKKAYASDPAYELGAVRLTRGKVVLEFIVADMAGNERNLSYTLNVE